MYTFKTTYNYIIDTLTALTKQTNFLLLIRLNNTFIILIIRNNHLNECYTVIHFKFSS